EELRRLAPFGLANPGVTLLLPSCELGDLAAVGDGKHLRFRVRDRGRDAGSAIAFGLGAQLDRFRQLERYDVIFRLEANQWNGTGGLARLPREEDRPAERVPPGEVLPLVLLVRAADLVVVVLGEPVLHGAPVERLVAVPVVGRGADQPDQGHAAPLDPRSGLGE